MDLIFLLLRRYTYREVITDYDRLSKIFLENNFQKWKVNTTLFIKKFENGILLVQIYDDGIIFDATDESLCKDFSDMIHNEFEMSMMGELRYFFGLQIYQSKKCIFINQDKYFKELLILVGMEKVNLS